MVKVGEEEIRRVARLAHLALPDDEIRAAAAHLERLLGYIEQMRRLDVASASETIHAGTRTTPLRADEPVPGFPRDVMTRAAPRAPAGLFEVPKVLGGADDVSAAVGGDGPEDGA